jgi:hypothetical protein
MSNLRTPMVEFGVVSVDWEVAIHNIAYSQRTVKQTPDARVDELGAYQFLAGEPGAGRHNLSGSLPSPEGQ